MQKSANAVLLMVVAFVALRIDTTNTRSYAPICYQKDGIFIPMQGSCSGFFICIEGNAIASSCGSYYRFNPETRHCDHPERVQCYYEEEEKYPITTDDYNPVPEPIVHIPKPKYPNEVVPDEGAGDICHRKRNGELLSSTDSCTQYYVCLQQLPYRRTCPTLLHFNAKLGLCQAPALAQCVAHHMTPDEEK